jgi:macrolide-specific efflux system membrane fusion protein
MRISRPLVINVVLAVVVIGAIVGGVLLLHPFGVGATTATADTTQLTSTVQQGVVAKSISASGSIAPAQETSASFAVSGTITGVGVAVGQTVTAGQVLGTIDATPLQKAQQTASLQLANARAQLASAEASAAAPAGSGGGGGSSTSSASQLTSAKSQVTTAQSTYNDATAAIAEATLTAPVAGLVVSVNGTVGSSTQAGSTVQAVTPTGTASSSGGSSAFVTIADVTSLTVSANIAEADIASISVGQAATVSFPALGTTTAPAKVTAIAPTATASNSSVSYATTITLDSVPTGLRLGQTAQVAITTATSKDDALYVPTAAITTANGASTVKVVAADGTTTTVDVTLGVVGDAGTQVVTGLKKGETVVIGSVSNTQTSTTNGTNTRRFGGFGGGTGAGGGAGGFTGGTGGFGGGNRTGGGTTGGANN